MKSSKNLDQPEYIKFKPIKAKKEIKDTNNSKFFKIMCNSQFLVIFHNIPVN